MLGYKTDMRKLREDASAVLGGGRRSRGPVGVQDGAGYSRPRGDRAVRPPEMLEGYGFVRALGLMVAKFEVGVSLSLSLSRFPCFSWLT